MSVNYDFYKNPTLSEDDENTHYHARIVPKGTVSGEQLMEEIHSRCTLSTADIAAALVALADITAEKLKDGYCVSIDGLGSLQMTLKCPSIESQKEIRAESIRFKSIAFRPAARMKQRLKDTTFIRQKEKSHSKGYSEAEIDGLLEEYFQTSETITRSQFQTICGFTYSTAVRHLKRLREEGKIVNMASIKHPLYRKA